MEPPRTARLILSQGAKRILVTFLVLGVLGYSADVVLNWKVFRNESSLTSLEGANSVLAGQIASAKALSKTCALSQTSCVEQYFTRIASDFGAFGVTVAGISFPPSARADAVHLETDSTNLVSLLDQVTSAGSAITQAQLDHLQALGDTFDADYSQVIADLTVSL